MTHALPDAHLDEVPEVAVHLEEEPQRVYFYIHKLLGYLIGFYLVAGLPGAIH